ncbi:hypothetical protein [Arthrobacter sp. Br18]|uniref:hypothetical protein n=1 Tax=Arthrobacter sp. Br18 TaxID=1312954 RepID=UPI0012DD4461|nr:hypothetical protein [Arthrobacter sp. Br18]
MLISPVLVIIWKDEDEDEDEDEDDADAAAGNPYLRIEDLHRARAIGEAITANPRNLIDRNGDCRHYEPRAEFGARTLTCLQHECQQLPEIVGSELDIVILNQPGRRFSAPASRSTTGASSARMDKRRKFIWNLNPLTPARPARENARCRCDDCNMVVVLQPTGFETTIWW